MCDMEMEISSTTKTHAKVFHVGTFKEDTLGEEGTDLEYGGDFDWRREVCSEWQGMGCNVWGQVCIMHIQRALCRST